MNAWHLGVGVRAPLRSLMWDGFGKPKVSKSEPKSGLPEIPSYSQGSEIVGIGSGLAGLQVSASVRVGGRELTGRIHRAASGPRIGGSLSVWGTVVLLALVVMSTLAQPTSAISMRVTMTDLGTLGGDQSRAYAVNDAGQVVGVAQMTSRDYHAFLWKSGVMTDLGTLGGGYSAAYGINEAGQIVGESDGHAFLWDSGVMRDLGSLGPYSAAYGINEAGQIVGSSDSHAVLWQDGTIRDLGTLGGPFSFASSINDAGQITGASTRTFPAIGDWHPFVWESGTMTDLGGPDVPGGGYSYGFDINNQGQVVGSGTVRCCRIRGVTDFTTGALLWQSGTIVELGMLKTHNRSPGSEAFGINDAGQVVGASVAREGGWHAVFWEAGRITDLVDHRIREVRDSEARGISDAGWIVGWSATGEILPGPGFEVVTHAVLWTKG